MNITFPKLYRYDRIREHAYVAIPFKMGELQSEQKAQIWDGDILLPTQNKVTSYHKDGSIRYLFVRFMADLPANHKKQLEMKIGDEKNCEVQGIKILKKEDELEVHGGVEFAVKDDSENLFEYVKVAEKAYRAKQFVGPVLVDGDDCCYQTKLGAWELEEEGPLVTILSCMGKCVGNRDISFQMRVICYAEKPWLEISYRIINTTTDPLHVKSLVFGILSEEEGVFSPMLKKDDFKGDYHTVGIKELPEIEKEITGVRTCVGSSNYKTDFIIGKDGKSVEKYVDAEMLLKEANEHFFEVFYGTFFADRTDENGGICATIFQAQQNYPKAVKADVSGIYVMLVPENVGKIVMQPGMSREQRFLLHFHDAAETLTELDNRSLIYQMPDKPFISPEVFAKADVMPDIFVAPERVNQEVELALIARCDGHGRAMGMLNFGDAPDANYTSQGRGNGKLVWSNNEYDFPHACALQYARTGERRFLDYLIASARHWMDVDVCHYSDNPLHVGGQWEHCANHCGMDMVCSHEWVEGLLDYYHFTGEKRAFDTAIGIGENILRLLETPTYQVSGESNARETGWALRTLTALYVETHDEKWLAKADWIISHFKEWTREYDGWIAPYTDNTLIRVGFMISVAAGSLMRYYRVFPNEELKKMLLEAVDDLIENGMLGNGVFYYKELPSLSRIGTNTLLLEALTIGYELTGDTGYLSYGMNTFKSNIKAMPSGAPGTKSIAEDAVVYKNASPKNFAQSFIPLTVFYKALTDHGML
ncbi:MAG: glycoside hydrolase family 127 protein [Lachnospiraceae bacterium]|nr:glycoside hydrolase family 127 protein [Lachnospiraceae bacterium]